MEFYSLINHKDEKAIKNPLAQALGIVLHDFRERRGSSSNEIADELGIGTSTYRMIESGASIPQPEKIPQLLKIFDKINFSSICYLISAIQIMNTAGNSTKKMRELAVEVCDNEEKLKKLFEKFEFLWDIIESEDSKKIGKLIKAHSLDLELRNFLVTPMHHKQFEDDNQLYSNIAHLISNTPPFYLNLALDLLKNLGSYPPSINLNELAKWEEQHKQEVTGLYLIMREHHCLTGIEPFDYNFLWQDNFQVMQAIYLSDISEEELLAEFSKKLHAVLSRNPEKYKKELEDFDKGLKKIQLKNGFSTLDRINKVLFYKDYLMSKICIHKFEYGNVVAFTDNYPYGDIYETKYHDNMPSVLSVSLLYEDTVNILNQFEEVWREL